MPITYEFGAADCDLQTTFSGTVTVADLERYFDAVVADPRFSTCRTEIVEMHNVVFEGFNFDSVSRFSKHVVEHDGTLTSTALVSAEPVPYGLSRMYQALLNDEERVRVFKDRAAAVAWLRSLDGPAGGA